MLTSIAVECGPITSVAVSADHTTVAAGHADGNIFTWEIARSARPFLHIQPLDHNRLQARRADGHVSGVAVLHMGFLGTRHTALVSADDRGMAFSHLATRGMGVVARTVKTTRILGRYPDSTVQAGKARKPSSVLAFSPLLLGNVEQPTDSMGMVAMLTPYLLVIVSTTPVARTQHKAARPKEVAEHSAMSAALAWFPAIKLKAKDSATSRTKLVYCWSNVLTVLEVKEVEPSEPVDKDKPPSLQFNARSRWRSEEAIVAVQWLSRSVLAVLTITQQLLILEDDSLHVTDSFDLIHKHLYHVDLYSSQLHALVEQLDEEDSSMHGVVADAFFMSFRAYKGRLFLLGFNDMSFGSLSNWADRLLAFMEAGDFIGAIRLATSYYSGEAEKLTIGLPEESESRHAVVQEKLVEMISASLKYAFGRNQQAGKEQLEKPQLEELAAVCIGACVSMANTEFLFDDVYPWYEDHSVESIFLDVLEPFIIRGEVRSLPPTAIKALIIHYTTNHTDSRLEEIICLLDTSTMDIDQVTTLCKEHNLYDAFIYVWNQALGDYTTPLNELLHLSRPHIEIKTNGEAVEGGKGYTNAMKMFPYLSYILTSRKYPTGEELSEHESTKAKIELYTFLFSGRTAPTAKSRGAMANEPIEGSFRNLRTILEFDAASFMSVMNEAFEDGFLNESPERLSNGGSTSYFGNDVANSLSVNRQYIVSILLELMTPANFNAEDTIYLDMFIARNLPKYPQYILLSGTTLHQVLTRLCNFPSDDVADDCQLSAEYLLSMYHPPDIQSLIPLFKASRFYRVLKATYKSEKQYPELLQTYFEDVEDQDAVFDCIRECLQPRGGLSTRQQRDIESVVKEHAHQLVLIDVRRTAETMEGLAPGLHPSFLGALNDDPHGQYTYLNILLEPQAKVSNDAIGQSKHEHRFVERYVQLMCQYNPSHVADYVDVLKAGDLQLEEVLPAMESSGIIDAAVVLLACQGKVRDAMDRLINHLGTLEAALRGIVQNAEASPDSASTDEAIEDLCESLQKYARVGIWLCQNQTKSAQKARTSMKSAKRAPAASKQPLSFEEKLWLDLVEMVVHIAQTVSPVLAGGSAQLTTGAAEMPSGAADREDRLASSLRSLVKQVFTALLTSTTAPNETPAERTDFSFLRILRTFLTNAAAASPSLSELRAVIASIFSAYSYEESLLALANSMLDKDLFVHVHEVSKLRQRGWRPRGQICEVCRRRVWGPGAGGQIWDAWEDRIDDEAKRREAQHLERSSESGKPSRAKGKAAAEASIRQGQGVQSVSVGYNARGEDRGDLGPVAVFSCRHLFHLKCLGKASTRPGEAERSLHVGRGPELCCPVCT